ncbi:nucleotide exchange factor GrpE [Pseudonocardia sp. DSM 110487]|uniref:nucleotide exchange factor GrpE n=1 Tax=Pseudonocardia sp. DSM 110487 TaxID=2865833 RepID=UPI001C6A289C|nr:nucleotide exchange factor GrpE [Pseudonocardia sp. DSM 110487]QYN38299.1 nucleotide exchange factor GrpE [Pseudonocardia sp. DSM 110487]
MSGTRGIAGAAGVGFALLGGTAAFLISWLMAPTAPPVTEPGVPPSVSESAWEVPFVTIATVLTGIVATVVVLWLGRRDDSTIRMEHVAGPACAPDPRLAERETAIRELAELVGRLPPEFEWQAANVLRSAGADQILADGNRFDPAVHFAVGTESAPDPTLHDVVARTIKPGWADRGRVVVPARVVVYVAASEHEVLP